MPKLYDISRVIAPTSVVYAGSKPLGLAPLSTIGPDSPWRITRLDWTTHFLTHVDPPCHCITGGATLDQIPLSRFMGRAVVVAVPGDVIEPGDLPELSAGINVLFKTRNSTSATDAPFDENYVYLSANAAERLAEAGVNLVGIDYLSVDRFGDDRAPSHFALLGQNVLILEGLDLSTVSPGFYTLIAFPLRIADGDGSPVRAVLLPDD